MSIEIHEKLIRSNPKFIETIDWYTADGYEDFNRRLRIGDALSSLQNDHLAVLDELFSLVKTTVQPIVVYKGIRTEEYESDKSFISTTPNEFEAYEFTKGNCCLLQITISPGSKVLYLENMSEFKHEKEILLNRDCKIFITGRQTEFPKSKIFATYMPKSSIGIHSIQMVEKAVDLKEVTERIKSYFFPDDFVFNNKEDFERESTVAFKKAYIGIEA